MHRISKPIAALVLAGALSTAFAQAPKPLSPQGESSKNAFEALIKQTSGVSDSRLDALKNPGTLEYLSSPSGMMGFLALQRSLEKYPEGAVAALTAYADLLPKIDHLTCWDGYQSIYLVRAAQKANPALGERLRLSYIDLIKRTITKSDFPGGLAELAPKFFQKSLEHLSGNAMRGELLNRPAPKIEFLWCSNPNLKQLSDLFPGKVVVLDFWATWCKPCIGLFPKVREVAAKYAGKPVVFVGVTSIQGYHIDPEKGKIDCKGDPAKEMSLMPDLMKQLNITWTVAFGDKDCFNPDFDIMGIPHMAILDKNGVVRFDGVEPEALEEKIDSLLGGGSK